MSGSRRENDPIQTARLLLIFFCAEPVTVICSRINFVIFRNPFEKIILEVIVAAAMQSPRMMICEFFKILELSINSLRCEMDDGNAMRNSECDGGFLAGFARTDRYLIVEGRGLRDGKKCEAEGILFRGKHLAVLRCFGVEDLG